MQHTFKLVQIWVSIVLVACKLSASVQLLPDFGKVDLVKTASILQGLTTKTLDLDSRVDHTPELLTAVRCLQQPKANIINTPETVVQSKPCHGTLNNTKVPNIYALLKLLYGQTKPGGRYILLLHNVYDTVELHPALFHLRNITAVVTRTSKVKTRLFDNYGINMLMLPVGKRFDSPKESGMTKSTLRNAIVASVIGLDLWSICVEASFDPLSAVASGQVASVLTQEGLALLDNTWQHVKDEYKEFKLHEDLTDVRVHDLPDPTILDTLYFSEDGQCQLTAKAKGVFERARLLFQNLDLTKDKTEDGISGGILKLCLSGPAGWGWDSLSAISALLAYRSQFLSDDSGASTPGATSSSAPELQARIKRPYIIGTGVKPFKLIWRLDFRNVENL